MTQENRNNTDRSIGNHLISTQSELGKIQHQILEEVWEFPMPVSNQDPFNLQKPNFKFEDISIYLSLNEDIDQGPKFLMDLDEQVCVSRSSTSMGQIQKHFQEKQSLKKGSPPVGETKNIPKNFGKQFIKFVKKNEPLITKILIQMSSQLKYHQLNSQLQKRKGKMNKISDLQDLWLQKTKFGKQMRVISSYYLRKHGYNWIFNSRIQDFRSHLKYRAILSKSIMKPQQFVYLKSDSWLL